MQRVVVVGNAGGGKTTLSRELGARLALPVIHLDSLIWRPGWQATPKAEFEAQHRAIVAGERWIIDGLATWESVVERVAAADTVIFPDYALWQSYLWALKRQAQSIVRPRPELPANCPMLPKTWVLLRLMWRVHRNMRPRILALLGENLDRKRVIYLQTPAQTRQFLAQLPVYEQPV